jgi:hypothetical protein
MPRTPRISMPTECASSDTFTRVARPNGAGHGKEFGAVGSAALPPGSSRSYTVAVAVVAVVVAAVAAAVAVAVAVVAAVAVAVAAVAADVAVGPSSNSPNRSTAT